MTFSAFWGTLAYTLIGGTAVGTVLTLVFLPALYSIWFRVKPTQLDREGARNTEPAKSGDDVDVPHSLRYRPASAGHVIRAHGETRTRI